MNGEGAENAKTGAAAGRSALWTIPNLLSLLRILLVPVFVLEVSRGRAVEALAIFSAASLTDALDGWAARRLGQRSRLGMILDPAGDKLLLTCAYVVLTISPAARPNAIPLWLTLTVFGRDVLIVGGALAAFLLWRVKAFPPLLLGKISTVCQVATVFLVLLFNVLKTAPPALTWAFGLTLAVGVLSAAGYTRVGLRMLKSRRGSR